jgi:hypothetical protein
VRDAGSPALETEIMPISSTLSEIAQATPPAGRNGEVPPLESGDRLTADEFMRRYEAMPRLKKANSSKESSTYPLQSDTDATVGSTTCC